MPENYRGYTLNQPNDPQWGERENAFHKQIINKVEDELVGPQGDTGAQGPQGDTGAQGPQGDLINRDEFGDIPVSELDHVVRTELSTGLIEGGVLSINISDDSTYDISAGHGHIVDYWTDIDNPVVIDVTWDAFTGVTPTNLTLDDSTYVAIDRDGNIIEYTSVPNNSQRRETIWLGKLIHRNRSNIVTASSQPDHSLSTLSQVRDFISAIKYINISGNIISPNDADLTIMKSTGVLFGNGINYSNDIKNPHTQIFSTYSPVTFRYLTQIEGYVSSDLTTIIPNSYDVDGTITTVPNNKWTNQRIYLFPSGNIRIQYGQVFYSSVADAMAGIEVESFIVNSDVNENAILLTVLSIKKECTDLSDIDTARFTNASKFGEVVSGAGNGSTTTLQKAYDNSTEPEIITNSALGAVTYRDGTGVDGAKIIEVQNSLGVLVAYIDENGVISGNISQSAIRNIVSVSTTYSANVGDLVKATANVAYNITLPSAINNTGKPITIKKVDGNFPITVDTILSQTIDGKANIQIGFTGTSIDFISDGTNWIIK